VGKVSSSKSDAGTVSVCGVVVVASSIGMPSSQVSPCFSYLSNV
jgi:hypothetical protein